MERFSLCWRSWFLFVGRRADGDPIAALPANAKIINLIFTFPSPSSPFPPQPLNKFQSIWIDWETVSKWNRFEWIKLIDPSRLEWKKFKWTNLNWFDCCGFFFSLSSFSFFFSIVYFCFGLFWFLVFWIDFERSITESGFLECFGNGSYRYRSSVRTRLVPRLVPLVTSWK